VRLIALLAYLAACGAAEPGPGGAETDTGTSTAPSTTDTPEPAEPPPFLKSDEQGSLVLVEKAFGITGETNATLYGAFADTLGSVHAAARCVAGDLCLPNGLPAQDNWADVSGATWPPGSLFSWVGDSVAVGSVDAPFAVDPATGFSYYQDVESPIQDKDPWRVSLGGEWGAWEQTVAERVRMVATAPDLESGITFGEGGLLRFEWEAKPDVASEVVLRIVGPGVDRVYNLVDDGSFDVSLDTVNWDPLGDYKVTLERWTTTAVEVNDGNELEIVAVDATQWTALECADFPNLIIESNDNSFLPRLVNPVWITMAFNGVIAQDHVFDGYYDWDADGDDDPFMAQLVFTIYDGDPVAGLIGVPLCNVFYDASDAVPVDPDSLYQVGGPDVTDYPLYQAFLFALHDGYTDCGPLDLAAYGTTDVRAYLERDDVWQWGMAIGEGSPQDIGLKIIFGNPGWQQYAATSTPVWLTPNGATLYEAAVGLGLEIDCPAVAMPEDLIPTVTSAPFQTAWWNTIPWTVFTFAP
jgi:hypothetical protein